MDQERFGIAVARGDELTADAVPDLLAFCRENDAELLIARCDGADVMAIRALLAAGLTQVESHLTTEGPIEPRPQSDEIRVATTADEERITEIAAVGYGAMATHYHSDPRLPLDKCCDLYVDWALRILRGETADRVFAAEIDGEVVAFMMFGLEQKTIHQLLTVVLPEARGQGFYNKLLATGMCWGVDAGADRMAVVTPLGNVAAQRNLARVGQLVTSSTVTFHGWRDATHGWRS